MDNFLRALRLVDRERLCTFIEKAIEVEQKHHDLIFNDPDSHQALHNKLTIVEARVFIKILRHPALASLVPPADL